jgi:hypothetical protein
MYQEFRISAINADLKNKSVTIESTFELDPDTVTEANIQLYCKDTRNDIGFDIKLAGKVITLNLLDWPEPNIDYVISVQKLKTVLGDELVSGVRRKLVFESSVCSKCEITYPAYDEVIENLKVAWKEILPSETSQYVSSYYIEISTESAFHNIVEHTTVIGRTELDISDLKDGQYFVRCRAQKDNEYGLWSDTITFIIGDETAKPGPIFDPNNTDENEDIYIPDINVLSTPTNGTTPETILIEFDCDIDPDSIENIIVLRRQI